MAAWLRSLRGRTTIVSVPHRAASLVAADRVVVLESERVAVGSRRASGRPGSQAIRRRQPEDLPAAEWRWLTCVLLAMLVAAAHAPHAQSVEDFRSQATVRVGPLYLRSSLEMATEKGTPVAT